ARGPFRLENRTSRLVADRLRRVNRVSPDGEFPRAGGCLYPEDGTGPGVARRPPSRRVILRLFRKFPASRLIRTKRACAAREVGGLPLAARLFRMCDLRPIGRRAT